MDFTKGDLAKSVLKWKTLLLHINFPKTTLVRCYV